MALTGWAGFETDNEAKLVVMARSYTQKHHSLVPT
jgi:hypothetical protein